LLAVLVGKGLRHLAPRKRRPSKSIRSEPIQGLIHSIKDSFIMDVLELSDEAMGVLFCEAVSHLGDGDPSPPILLNVKVQVH